PANSRKRPLVGAARQVRHKPARLESRRPPASPRRARRSATIQSGNPPASELLVHAGATLARSPVSSVFSKDRTGYTLRWRRLHLLYARNSLRSSLSKKTDVPLQVVCCGARVRLSGPPLGDLLMRGIFML